MKIQKEQNFQRKKGSMTAAMSLMLLLLVSLLTVCIQGSRIACARVQAVNGIQSALYSVFSEYDRELLEQYHLFFLDAGYGGGQIDLGRLIEHTEQFAEPVLNTGITRARIQICAVDSFSLASDQQGRAAEKQIVTYMKENLGSTGIRMLKERQKQQAQIMEHQEEIEKEGIPDTDLQSTEPMPDISENNNPLEIIQRVKEHGFLGLVLPEEGRISPLTQEGGELLSRREKQEGKGTEKIEEQEDGFLEKLLIQEYILETLGFFTEKKNEGSLEYQVEYVIGRKNSDKENLKAVVNRLLLLREVSNVAYLYTDPQKRSEIQSCAAALSLLFLIPEGMTLVQAVLAGGWAYMESISDVRILLGGGQVPLVKNEASWKTSLGNLGEERGTSADRGLDYKAYLRILLSFSGKENLVMGCMDMIEQNMRRLKGKENFSFDSCLDSVTMSFQIQDAAGNVWRAKRFFSYEM